MIVVTVSAPDLDSVYRIFSVLNNRGLNLSYSDILKSDIITTIPQEQQDDYATKWEELETLLETEEFENLLFDLRMIYSKKRLNKGMIEEFHQYVYPGSSHASTPQQFIDEILYPYAHALDAIVKAKYQFGLSPTAKANAEEINAMFKWLNYLDHGRWIPPALYYFVLHHRQQQSLVIRFLIDLERLVASFEICRLPPYRRLLRYCEILEAISQEKDLFAPQSPLQLTYRERQDTFHLLNGDIYLLRHICRYVLLRLDAYRTEKGVTYDRQTVSLEHILPQRPAPDSKWRQLFPSKEIHEKYVHRLGNLVLLSKSKNKRAENFDFEQKKQEYFFSKGVSTPFVLTNDLREYREWTPTIVDQRQKHLMQYLAQMWRL